MTIAGALVEQGVAAVVVVDWRLCVDVLCAGVAAVEASGVEQRANDFATLVSGSCALRCGEIEVLGVATGGRSSDAAASGVSEEECVCAVSGQVNECTEGSEAYAADSALECCKINITITE